MSAKNMKNRTKFSALFPFSINYDASQLPFGPYVSILHRNTLLSRKF